MVVDGSVLDAHADMVCAGSELIFCDSIASARSFSTGRFLLRQVRGAHVVARIG